MKKLLAILLVLLVLLMCGCASDEKEVKYQAYLIVGDYYWAYDVYYYEANQDNVRLHTPNGIITTSWENVIIFAR